MGDPGHVCHLFWQTKEQDPAQLGGRTARSSAAPCCDAEELAWQGRVLSWGSCRVREMCLGTGERGVQQRPRSFEGQQHQRS